MCACSCVCVLQAVNDAAANPQSESMPIIGMGAEYPQLMEVAERLNENVAQLHRSICLFMGQAWKKASPHLALSVTAVSVRAQAQLPDASGGAQVVPGGVGSSGRTLDTAAICKTD